MNKKLLILAILSATSALSGMEPLCPPAPKKRSFFRRIIKVLSLKELAAKAVNDFYHSSQLPPDEKQAFQARAQQLPAELYPMLLEAAHHRFQIPQEEQVETDEIGLSSPQRLKQQIVNEDPETRFKKWSEVKRNKRKLNFSENPEDADTEPNKASKL